MQRLLEFARDREPQKVPANVNEIMKNAIGIVKNEFRLRHVPIELKLAEDMQKIMLDENQIEQVFINLLLNALQAVDEKGRVSVQSVMDSEHNNIRVEIVDNGCGISETDVKKIFEHFFSTKSQGTGLGLAVSYGIVRNHQGDIQVFSTPGEGTRFVMDFPIQTADVRKQVVQ